jgi:hypothetical protein
MKLPLKILVWYDNEIKLYTAIYHDVDGYQIGNAGYGVRKKDAIDDVKYQKALYDEVRLGTIRYD